MGYEGTESTMGCEATREQLPWWLNGTLPEREREETARHLEDCEACREELERVQEASAIYAQHIPLHELVDYGLGVELRGLSRATLEGHLAHCEECAEELGLVQRESPPAAPPAPFPSPPAANRWRWAVGLAAALALVWVWQTNRAPAARPTGSVEIVELLPESLAVRGTSSGSVPSIEGATVLLLVSDRAESFEEVRLRATDTAGELLWEETDLKRSEDGTYPILLPEGSLPERAALVTLEGRRGAAWTEIERYQLEAR